MSLSSWSGIHCAEAAFTAVDVCCRPLMVLVLFCVCILSGYGLLLCLRRVGGGRVEPSDVMEGNLGVACGSWNAGISISKEPWGLLREMFFQPLLHRPYVHYTKWIELSASVFLECSWKLRRLLYKRTMASYVGIVASPEHAEDSIVVRISKSTMDWDMSQTQSLKFCESCTQAP